MADFNCDWGNQSRLRRAIIEREMAEDRLREVEERPLVKKVARNITKRETREPEA